MIDGRWLNTADTKLHTRVGGARRRPREAVRATCAARTARSGSTTSNFGVVGVLGTGRARSRSRQRGVHHAVGGEARLRDRRQAEPALRPVEDRHHAGDRRRDPDRDQPRRSRPGVDEGAERRAASRVAGRQDAAADRAVRGLARARGRRARHRERHVDLGDPTIVGDRHPARGRAQPVEDRLAVPARVAVRRHARRDPRSRARDRCRVSRVVVRGLGRRDRVPEDPDLDGARAGRVGRSRGCTRRSRPRASRPLETLRLG